MAAVDFRGGISVALSFTEVSSTSGWLVPTFWLRQRGIDPKRFFRYSEEASHAANELAVASGQVDLATDFDRNRNAMIESGRLAPDATKMVWTSQPLPNDAIGVRKGLDHVLAARIRDLEELNAVDHNSAMGSHGAGLGLLIAHGLTAAHGGEISVRNHADGCRFAKRLPLAPAMAAPHPQVTSASAGDRARRSDGGPRSPGQDGGRGPARRPTAEGRHDGGLLHG